MSSRIKPWKKADRKREKRKHKKRKKSREVGFRPYREVLEDLNLPV